MGNLLLKASVLPTHDFSRWNLLLFFLAQQCVVLDGHIVSLARLSLYSLRRLFFQLVLHDDHTTLFYSVSRRNTGVR